MNVLFAHHVLSGSFDFLRLDPVSPKSHAVAALACALFLFATALSVWGLIRLLKGREPRSREAPRRANLPEEAP